MRRRSRAGGEPITGRRPQTSEPERRNAPKAPAARSNSAVGREETEVVRLTRELREERKQRTAISEVLYLLSGSHGDLNRLFDTILTNATKLCRAKFGALFLCEADAFRIVAQHNAPPAYAELRQREPLTRGRLLLRAAETKQLVHIADIGEYLASNRPDKDLAAFAKVSGVRTLLVVPMLKDGEVVGEIVIYRQEVRTFSDREIDLLKSFAAQAVIAIENARLLNELRQRTDDLTESLDRQTATSEVLRVISTSSGDMKPVFEAMLANALRLCEAKFGHVLLYDGERYHAAHLHDVPPSYRHFWEQHGPLFPSPNTGLARLARTKQVTHIPDLKADPAYAEREPLRVITVEEAGARTLLAVPMVTENKLVGAIVIYRKEVQPFSDKQIELVKNFAAQAVIAIENARLLSELRESLEQQTATAEVLGVITSSPGDLAPVFDAMLKRATQLCGAGFGTLWTYDGERFNAAATHAVPAAFAEFVRQPVPLAASASFVDIVGGQDLVHLPDLAATELYHAGNPIRRAIVDLGGARTMISVALRKDNTLLGVFNVYRQEVRPFSDKQIELVQNFAAQAVIAIENTRLLNELRESLQQQFATADVLKVISRSTFDLQAVLQTLVESAARLCDADKGSITREKDGVLYWAAESYGYSREFLDHIKGLPIETDRGSATGRALFEGRVIHIPDVKADQEYTMVEGQRLGDYRTVLAVPMLRESVALGVLTLTRSDVRSFTDKQIELVTTFADQAAIAIENMRLFEAERQRTRELAESLEDLRTTQDRLVQTQKLASLGQLTAGIAHEIKNPLNFVNNFSGVSVELIDELQQALESPQLDNKARAEIAELANTLRGNLDKIVQHGKRADAIVKNMLLHSREGSGEHRLVDINALVDESLNLAYHGARAENQRFQINMERSFDPAAGEVDVFPQEITRALLNLISNGFYAATKRKEQNDSKGYEPTLTATTKNLGDRVEIRIRDNGTGIPPDVKEKMFNPFFTTKPSGEGTGLGLSICHDIIVKQHSGSIEVDSQLGDFTEIRIILPRKAAFMV
jgi:two-component system, NtrC family, sensor kinase